MMGEDCQTASSTPDGEEQVLSRLRWQRHRHELSGIEQRSLVLDNEKQAGPVSAKNNVQSPFTCPPLTFFIADDLGDQIGWRETSRVKEG